MADVRVHKKIDGLIDFCRKHGFGLLLTNGEKSIHYVLSKRSDPVFEKFINFY